ncbi:MAG: hypothetical protein KDC90_14990 [Ignavibacteriae bacterium]|nr:hypothetical protein [Ignavibacteriota bacterium]
MNHLEHLKSNKKTFFNFMKEEYPLFQHSNVFFRDLQYAIKSYFELKENSVSYFQAGKIAEDFIKELENSNDLQRIDHKSWRVNFEVGIKPKIAETEVVSNE